MESLSWFYELTLLAMVEELVACCLTLLYIELVCRKHQKSFLESLVVLCLVSFDCGPLWHFHIAVCGRN